MAYELFFNTQTTSNSGTKLDIAYARTQVILLPNEATIDVRLDLYESSTAFTNKRKTILLDEVPSELHRSQFPITSGQYANLDMTNIHNQMAGILMIGASHGSYPSTGDPGWGGLQSYDPSNNVTVVMPS